MKLFSFLYRCNNRFFHSWNTVEDYRKCNVCGVEETRVGWYQLDADLGAIPQWERVCPICDGSPGES